MCCVPNLFLRGDRAGHPAGRARPDAERGERGERVSYQAGQNEVENGEEETTKFAEVQEREEVTGDFELKSTMHHRPVKVKS